MDDAWFGGVESAGMGGVKIISAPWACRGKVFAMMGASPVRVFCC